MPRDQRGVTPLEYTIMAALAAMLIATCIVSMSSDLEFPFGQAVTALQSANGGGSSSGGAISCPPGKPHHPK